MGAILKFDSKRKKKKREYRRKLSNLHKNNAILHNHNMITFP